MIRLTKHQLLEIARVLMLANTPLSLLQGLMRCSALDSLRRQCPPEELLEYYDRITARARRSEVVVALAYTVLTAILLHARDPRNAPVDATRLLWGERMREYAERVAVGTDVLRISPMPQAPEVRALSSASNDTPTTLVGPDGRPLRWRDDL